jgi:hypothetical protein
VSAFEPNISALLVFAAAWLVCSAGFFYISGMFPLSVAPSGLRSGSGNFLILLNAALLVGLFVLALIFCYRELRWSSAVVIGGAIFLLAPFLTQDLPAALKNGKLGLLALLFLVVIAFALIFAAAGWQISTSV